MTTPAFCMLVPLPCAHQPHNVVKPCCTETRRRRPQSIRLSSPTTSAARTNMRATPTLAKDVISARSGPSVTRAPMPTPTSTSPTSPTPPPPNPKNNRSPDFHANVGTVIDALCADYPNILMTEPNLHIFRDDVILSDVTGYRLTGKDAYRAVLFLLRAHTRLFLTSASVHIQRLYYHDDTRPAIHVRWRMRASPRVWATSRRDVPVIVDGLCIYYLDSTGFVEHHAFEARVRGGRPVIRPVFQHVLSTGHIAAETGCASSMFDNSLNLSFPFGSHVSNPLLDAFSVSTSETSEDDGDTCQYPPRGFELVAMQNKL